MIINNNYNGYNYCNPYNKKNNNSGNIGTIQNQNVNFAGNGSSPFKKCFDWVAKKCNIDSQYSITREAFLFISIFFLMGGRFIESRGEDERREVLTRDIPAVVIAGYGAAALNNYMGSLATKLSGIPVMQVSKEKHEGPLAKLLGKEGQEKTVNKFASQKQVIDWYSGLEELQNPLITFSETIQRHKGNIEKAIKVLGLSDKLKNITGKENATNEEIITALKKAQEAKDKNFDILEGKIKELKADNKLVKKARNIQACVKLGGIAVVAGILGYFLPRLNIVTTKKKYQNINKNQTNNQVNVK